MTPLQADLTRFFVMLPFDTTRTREISDVHVSPVQRAALRERLARFNAPPHRLHARRLIEQLDAL